MPRRILAPRAVMVSLLLSAAVASSATASAADAAPAATRDVNSCAVAPVGYATCFAEFVADRHSGLLLRPHVVAIRRAAHVQRRRRYSAAFQPIPADDAIPTSEPAAAAEPAAGSPAYLQQAYDLTNVSATGGSGKTVAIVDAYEDPTAESDLAIYRSTFGLPACTSANGCFRKVNQSGTTGSYPAANSSWSEEISLDLDAVSALCPNCHIVLVEATSSSWLNLEAAEQTAASLGATQISDSWGTLSASAPPPTGSIFAPAGVDVVAGSGDSGYSGSGTGSGGDFYPAALATVTAAGATTIISGQTSGARELSESTWTDGGSGCDTNETQPSWQQGLACPGRAYADISADGNPQSGLTVYTSSAGGWVLAGGTSLSTPLVAAYYAITGVPATTPAWAYSHASLLNDVSTGVNGTCAASLTFICTAGIGFDGPTGNGSISGDVVVGPPGIDAPGSPTAGAASAQLQGSVYANGLPTTAWWEYGPTTSYGQTTPATSVGSGSADAATSATITGLAAATTYHYRLVAENVDGTSYGYDQAVATLGGAPPAPPQSTPPPATSPTTSVTSPSSSSSSSSSGTASASGNSASSGGTATSNPPAGRMTIISVKLAALHGASRAAAAGARTAGAGGRELIVKVGCSGVGSCLGTLAVKTAGGITLLTRSLDLTAGELKTLRLPLSARTIKRIDTGTNHPGRLLVQILPAAASAEHAKRKA